VRETPWTPIGLPTTDEDEDDAEDDEVEENVLS
jgi:hypothetical protein